MSKHLRAAIRRNRARDEYFMRVKNSENWSVYIVECVDGTFYTGITNNLERRINEHNHSTRGAKYTMSRRPVKLICHVQTSSRSEALKLEAAVKKQKRQDKLNFMKYFLE